MQNVVLQRFISSSRGISLVVENKIKKIEVEVKSKLIDCITIIYIFFKYFATKVYLVFIA